MKRLRTKIFWSLFAVSLLAFVATLFGSAQLYSDQEERQFTTMLHKTATLIGSHIPRGDAASDAIETEMRSQAEILGVGLGLWTDTGKIIFATEPGIPKPDATMPFPYWKRIPFGVQKGVMTAVQLPDKRLLTVKYPDSYFPHNPYRFPAMVIALTLGLGIVSFMFARRLTARLIRLQQSVQNLGKGQLHTRVDVVGRDEIAGLERSFNSAASQIESFITTQKQILANASHELRSPLTRLRMALSLLENPKLENRERRIRDATIEIEELDALIGDLLYAGRMDALQKPQVNEKVPLSDIVVNEAERVGAKTQVAPAEIMGDGTAIRRMIRNLVENAEKHAQSKEVYVTLDGSEEKQFVIEIKDRGPGIADADKSRIFEPFYRPHGHREGKEGGVGLGLSIAKQIADLHGGKIDCSSRPSGGTVFTVRLPKSGR